MKEITDTLFELIAKEYETKRIRNTLEVYIEDDIIKIQVHKPSRSTIDKELRPKHDNIYRVDLEYHSSIIFNALNAIQKNENHISIQLFGIAIARHHGDIEWRGGNPFWELEPDNNEEQIAKSMFAVLQSNKKLFEKVSNEEIDNRFFGYLEDCHDNSDSDEAFPLKGSRGAPDFSKHLFADKFPFLKNARWSMHLDFEDGSLLKWMQSLSSCKAYGLIWASVKLYQDKKNEVLEIIRYVNETENNEFNALLLKKINESS